MSDSRAKMKLVVGLAELFGENLSESRIAIYAGALQSFTASEVKFAIDEIVKDPSINRFPLPAIIAEKISPTFSLETAAQDLLSSAILAVAKFGYVDPGGAKDFVGPIVWRALPGESGWRDFCCTEIPQGTARAQLRERIASVLRRDNPNGRVNLPPPKDPPLRLSVPWPGEQKSQESSTENDISGLLVTGSDFKLLNKGEE